MTQPDFCIQISWFGEAAYVILFRADEQGEVAVGEKFKANGRFDLREKLARKEFPTRGHNLIAKPESMLPAGFYMIPRPSGRCYHVDEDNVITEVSPNNFDFVERFFTDF